MSTVTFHADDSPGAQLLKHEQELRIAHPHLSEQHARHLVRERFPDLCRLHHQGLQAEPEPTVDPGELINRRAYALQSTKQAHSFAEAVEIAMRELPEAAAAYARGQRMPAGSTRAYAEPAPRRHRSSDAGAEILLLMQEAMAADPALERRRGAAQGPGGRRAARARATAWAKRCR